MTTDSPDSFRRITDVLSQSLDKAFGEVCPKRYGAPLELQRTDNPSDPQTVAFRIEGPRSIALKIQVTITHVGGNVFDIATQVEDGRVRRFTYSEPASSGSSLSIAPYLGKKIAKHVLDEVEKRLGKKLLRNQIKTEAT
jgi:hypothetical protein